MKKAKHKPKKPAESAAEFHLVTGSRKRGFRFLGWLEDFLAFSVLDERDTPLVVIPKPIGPQQLSEFRRDTPACICKATSDLSRDELLEFCTRHGDKPQYELGCDERVRKQIRDAGLAVWPADQERLNRVSYRMDFISGAMIWLEQLRGPKPPDNPTDLDQIKRMLDARPELVRLTQDEIKTALGLKRIPDKRTLKRWCEFAGLDQKNLTRADIPALKLAEEHFRDRQRTKGISGQKKQAKRQDRG